MLLDATDEELMQAWVEGDSTTFDTPYGRHRIGLFRFLARQVRDHGTTEELFQDVWHKVIHARSRYRPHARFSTWLYKACSNEPAPGNRPGMTPC